MQHSSYLNIWVPSLVSLVFPSAVLFPYIAMQCTYTHKHTRIIYFKEEHQIPAMNTENKIISNIRGVSAIQKETYQSLSTNNEQPTSSIYLSKPHFLIEGAIPSHHHRDLIIKSPIRYIRRRTQNRCCLILQLQEWLKRKTLVKYIYIK